jgi:RNA polymerase sigma-70 factor (ECF subfamily)
MAEPAFADHAFPGIFERYKEPIRRYVMSLLHSPSEADDLTQETFLRAYRQLSSLQDPNKLSPWLYRIATNVCYDRFRQSANRTHPESLDGASPASHEQNHAESADQNSPRLDLVIEQKEMSTCVQEYLENLSDDYRAVILLHDLQGLSNPEIAEMLGCSLATVKIRLHRARSKLKVALEDACLFDSDERGVFTCQRKPQGSGPESQ